MLLIGYNSYAQNTLPLGGNVGIGTTSPTSGLTVQLEGGNVADGSLFLVNSTNSTFGGGATLSGIKTTAGDGGQYNFLKIQNAGGIKFLINGSGNVGIGNSSPQTKLDVLGGIFSSGGESHFSSGTYADPVPGKSYDIKTGANGIAVNGNSVFNQGVSIGTTNLPSGYKLAVNGSAIATSVTVKLNSQWPDYVLKKDYQLPSLSEVKFYIDQHQHLPEVPSEEQIAKEGLNLGEMNKLLMKKVEELTLYLIEEHKEKQDQRELLNKQQEQLNQLKEELKSLLEK